MNTYYVKFHGHNPIGAVAVVVAVSRPKALSAFKQHLLDTPSTSSGLLHKNRHLNAVDFVEIIPNVAQVVMLNNGDY